MSSASSTRTIAVSRCSPAPSSRSGSCSCSAATRSRARRSSSRPTRRATTPSRAAAPMHPTGATATAATMAADAGGNGGEGAQRRGQRRRSAGPSRRRGQQRHEAAKARQATSLSQPIETPPFTKLGLLEAAGELRAWTTIARSRRARSRWPKRRKHAADAGGTRSVTRAPHGSRRANPGSAPSCSASARPAASGDPGGQNLRDQIYFFPLHQPLPDRSGRSSIRRTPTRPRLSAAARGMSALEYLLFYDGHRQRMLGGDRHQHATARGRRSRASELAAAACRYAAAAAADVRRARARAGRGVGARAAATSERC